MPILGLAHGSGAPAISGRGAPGVRQPSRWPGGGSQEEVMGSRQWPPEGRWQGRGLGAVPPVPAAPETEGELVLPFLGSTGAG